MTDRDKNEKDLTLLLLYVSGWEEEKREDPNTKAFRSWKGYLFDVLMRLKEEELITNSMNKKSVIITPAGILKAKKLQKIVFDALENWDIYDDE